MYSTHISGIGHYVPERVVTNKDLEKLMDTTDEWIVERTGIKERRWIDPATDDMPSTMGTKAAKKATIQQILSPNSSLTGVLIARDETRKKSITG